MTRGQVWFDKMLLLEPDNNNLCQLWLAPGQVDGIQVQEAFNYFYLFSKTH